MGTMDETTYIKDMITAQVTALLATAKNALPANHTVVTALDTCLQSLTSPQPAVTPAAPLNRHVERDVDDYYDDDYYDDDYDDRGYVEEIITPDNVGEREDNVIGVVPTGEGTYVAVGDVDDAARELEAMIVDHIAETGEEIETDNTFTVTYTRLNGEELSTADVHRIIEHPVSAPLKNLGKVELYRVHDGEGANEKVAVFLVTEKGNFSLEGFAVNIMGYKGIQVFPGLGQVKAVGNVTRI